MNGPLAGSSRSLQPPGEDRTPNPAYSSAELLAGVQRGFQQAMMPDQNLEDQWC